MEETCFRPRTGTGISHLRSCEPGRRLPVYSGAPSVSDTRDGASELKFVVPASRLHEVLNWTREHLPADRHAAGSPDDSYWVHSVYLDTVDLADRHGSDPQRRFRIRRYGAGRSIFLEEKWSHQGRVAKSRTLIDEAEVSLLQSAAALEGWQGDWFRREVVDRRLKPSCQVTYQRVAREGELDDVPVRLTIDRDLRCAPARGFLPSHRLEQATSVPVTLLELKYRGPLPRPFEQAIERFALSPACGSKYGRAAKAWAPSRGD